MFEHSASIRKSSPRYLLLRYLLPRYLLPRYLLPRYLLPKYLPKSRQNLIKFALNTFCKERQAFSRTGERLMPARFKSQTSTDISPRMSIVFIIFQPVPVGVHPSVRSSVDGQKDRQWRRWCGWWWWGLRKRCPSRETRREKGYIQKTTTTTLVHSLFRILILTVVNDREDVVGVGGAALGGEERGLSVGAPHGWEAFKNYFHACWFVESFFDFWPRHVK